MRTKVTAELITEIKTRHNAGEAIIEIARTLGISYTLAREVVRDIYKGGPVDINSEFFDFNNRCVITGFSFPADREKKIFWQVV